MKILYAVQATGNGHISRAIQLAPFLQKLGELDVFLSGNNSSLSINLPVKYRSKGISLFDNFSGGLDYFKILRSNPWISSCKEAHDLPVERYDLILNDFEPIASLACRLKRKKSIQLSHQASFRSRLSPRPSKINPFGEWLLKWYSTSTHYFGLHFRPYDDFILPPVIQSCLIGRQTSDLGHIAVYLPSFGKAFYENQFRRLDGIQFHCFLKGIKCGERSGNIQFLPIGQTAFTASMLSARGVITGGGFETPAEVLYLQKRLMCIPCKNHYEQYCNAAALQRLGIFTLDPSCTNALAPHIEAWLDQDPVHVNILPNNLYETVQLLADTYRDLRPDCHGLEPDPGLIAALPASR